MNKNTRNNNNCAACGGEVGRLEMFPGDLCVECYRVTPEASAPMTARDLARMWGAR